MLVGIRMKKVDKKNAIVTINETSVRIFRSKEKKIELIIRAEETDE